MGMFSIDAGRVKSTDLNRLKYQKQENWSLKMDNILCAELKSEEALKTSF